MRLFPACSSEGGPPSPESFSGSSSTTCSLCSSAITHTLESGREKTSLLKLLSGLRFLPAQDLAKSSSTTLTANAGAPLSPGDSEHHKGLLSQHRAVPSVLSIVPSPLYCCALETVLSVRSQPGCPRSASKAVRPKRRKHLAGRRVPHAQQCSPDAPVAISGACAQRLARSRTRSER